MVTHRSKVKKIPKGFRKSDGIYAPVGYNAYVKGSRFDPKRYGKYTVVYVKDKRWDSKK